MTTVCYLTNASVLEDKDRNIWWPHQFENGLLRRDTQINRQTEGGQMDTRPLLYRFPLDAASVISDSWHVFKGPFTLHANPCGCARMHPQTLHGSIIQTKLNRIPTHIVIKYFNLTPSYVAPISINPSVAMVFLKRTLQLGGG